MNIAVRFLVRTKIWVEKQEARDMHACMHKDVLTLMRSAIPSIEKTYRGLIKIGKNLLQILFIGGAELEIIGAGSVLAWD